MAKKGPEADIKTVWLAEGSCYTHHQAQTSPQIDSAGDSLCPLGKLLNDHAFQNTNPHFKVRQETMDERIHFIFHL